MLVIVAMVRAVYSHGLYGPWGVDQVAGQVVGQVVEHHLRGCHLVLVTTSRHSHVTSSILSRCGVLPVWSPAGVASCRCGVLPVWRPADVASCRCGVLPVWRPAGVASCWYGVMPVWHPAGVAYCRCGVLPVWRPAGVASCWYGVMPVWHPAGVAYCQCGVLPVWRPAGVASCRCGVLPVWRPAGVASCQCGVLPVWRPAGVASCQCGVLPVWHPAGVASCRCGVLPVWRPAGVASCQCGVLPVWHPAGVASCRCGVLPVWRPAGVASCWYGVMPVWHPAGVAYCRCGVLPVWRPAGVASCRCGILPVWRPASVASCRCGVLPVWRPAGVASCRCGILPVWRTAGVASCQCGVLLVWRPAGMASCRCGILPVWRTAGVVSCQCGVCRCGVLLVWRHAGVASCWYGVLPVWRPAGMASCRCGILPVWRPAGVASCQCGVLLVWRPAGVASGRFGVQPMWRPAGVESCRCGVLPVWRPAGVASCWYGVMPVWHPAGVAYCRYITGGTRPILVVEVKSAVSYDSQPLSRSEPQRSEGKLRTRTNLWTGTRRASPSYLPSRTQSQQLSSENVPHHYQTPEEQLSQDSLLLQGLWGDSRTTCRGLVLDFTSNNNNTHLALRLVQMSGLWKLPETVVVAVGWRTGVREVLLHHSLRNTLHALYLALHHHTFLTCPPHPASRLKKVINQESATHWEVLVYRRCLYCNSGEASIQLLHKVTSNSNMLPRKDLFHENFQDLMGTKLRIATAMQYFPYVDYVRASETPGTAVEYIDCIDARIIHTFAAKLNFTFDVHEAVNRTWGVESNGTYSGMVGMLQREQMELSTVAAPTARRLRVVNHIMAYPSDTFTIASLKPMLLPKYLALIRPFKGELWVALLVSVGAWGVSLWLLQRVWQWVAGGRKVDLITSLLFGFGALLQNLPSDPSVSTSGRMLVGWWLLSCLIITTGFTSSLMAHLTVQKKSRPLESFEDLVKEPGWKWGTDLLMLSDAILDYFITNPNAIVKEIFIEMEVLEVDEALKKVLAGGFAFISYKNFITVIVAVNYTDPRGNSPFYISKDIPMFSTFGWCIRKGAPYHRRFTQLMGRLIAAGVITHWREDVIARREEDKEVVLSLSHMQGAFYLLVVGSAAAFLALLGENFIPLGQE
ncbi:uncharacterized protein [Procambarus clarkii]|uniref:uncharacterized protein n=1 Tax=Procambarus clarkii TaxID=6728 RepID=UPI0037422C5F